ncbi:TPA: ABC transporter permease, partial [bacterium]|nr:ABC transporter permease [bacterium]
MLIFKKMITIIDTLECAIRELRRRKARTIANIIGYLLAVSIMVIMINAFIYSRNASDSILNATGTHFIASVPANISTCELCTNKTPENKDEGFIVYGVPTKVISTKFINQVKKIEYIKDVSPALLYRIRSKIDGHIYTINGFDRNNSVAVQTTTCAETDIIKGRFMNPTENGSVILEEAYAKLHKINPGDKIDVAGNIFEVIGIINPGIRPAKADIYMHFDEAEQIINSHLGSVKLNSEANVILVETASSKVQKEAMRAMKDIIPELVFSSYACYQPASQVMGINETSALLFALIIGMFTMALSLKSQLSSVIERRRDIGILKAIGWADGSIVSQILIESLLQAIIGGFLGCIISVIILMIIPPKAIIGLDISGH